MESKIFDCVDNDDVEGLKLLINYPNLFQIEDNSGHTILQRAILYRRVAVADFLLSLDGYPINACNKKGETALQIALIHNHPVTWKEHVYSLLEKGADINCSPTDINISLLLHEALNFDHIKVAKFLINKGADINYHDLNGKTPLHVLFKIARPNRDELLAMLLYFGADLSIPDCDNCKPIDSAFLNGVFSESMQEHLLFYFFDDYCADYDIPLNNLFRLMQSNSPFAPQVLKHITSVYVDRLSVIDGFNCFVKLFTMKTEYLKLLLEKFDYVIRNIINVSFNMNWAYNSNNDYMFPKPRLSKNFDLMLQSQFSSDLIQIVNSTGICHFINQISPTLILPNFFNLIIILLSYGANIYDEDIEYIYKIAGDCEFFRILLHMDIKMRNGNRKYISLMPGLLYNIHIMGNESLLVDLNYFNNKYCSEEFLMGLEQLLNYFAHPKLKHFCRSVLRRYKGPSIFYRIRYDKEIHTMLAKVKNLPTVPLLVELARNQVRKFLIQKYEIANSMQFYTLIKHLPISKVHQKIITLETKLY